MLSKWHIVFDISVFSLSSRLEVYLRDLKIAALGHWHNDCRVNQHAPTGTWDNTKLLEFYCSNNNSRNYSIWGESLARSVVRLSKKIKQLIVKRSYFSWQWCAVLIRCECSLYTRAIWENGCRDLLINFNIIYIFLSL